MPPRVPPPDFKDNLQAQHSLLLDILPQSHHYPSMSAHSLGGKKHWFIIIIILRFIFIFLIINHYILYYLIYLLSFQMCTFFLIGSSCMKFMFRFNSSCFINKWRKILIEVISTSVLSPPINFIVDTCLLYFCCSSHPIFSFPFYLIYHIIFIIYNIIITSYQHIIIPSYNNIFINIFNYTVSIFIKIYWSLKS
jgi:hypothetical protein